MCMEAICSFFFVCLFPRCRRAFKQMNYIRERGYVVYFGKVQDQCMLGTLQLQEIRDITMCINIKFYFVVVAHFFPSFFVVVVALPLPSAYFFLLLNSVL